MISIDSQKCTQCGICYEICPNYVIQKAETVFDAKYPAQCCECGQCVASCKADAINLDSIKKSDISDLSPTKIGTEELKNLIYNRRSVRKYADKPVSKDDINELIDVAINSGSSSNGQTEGFIILKSEQKKREIEEAVIDTLWNAGLKFLNPGSFMLKVMTKKYGPEMIKQYIAYNGIINNRTMNNERKGMVFRNAPVVIIMHGYSRNVNGPANCALAIRNMELLALTKGLGTQLVGFLIAAFEKKPERFRQLLGIPEDRTIYGALLVGTPKIHLKKKIPRKARDIKEI